MPLERDELIDALLHVTLAAASLAVAYASAYTARIIRRWFRRDRMYD